MRREPVSFASDGLKLDGDLWLPADQTVRPPYPALIACSGFQGLKDMHPARFARALVPRGYACLGFDYRGFGGSEGVRGRVVPDEQVEDVCSGVGFLERLTEIDSDRIALLGWALGGGVAIAAAAEEPRVQAVAAVNAVGNGERCVRSTQDERSWRVLRGRIVEDRRNRAAGKSSERVPPFELFRLDEVTLHYVEEELMSYPEFGSPVTLESAEQLLSFRPEDRIQRIAPRPVLLVHGTENRLHPSGEAAELYRRAGEPTELVLFEGAGHTEWMHDRHPTFSRLVGLVSDFFKRSLGRSNEAHALG